MSFLPDQRRFCMRNFSLTFQPCPGNISTLVLAESQTAQHHHLHECICRATLIDWSMMRVFSCTADMTTATGTHDVRILNMSISMAQCEGGSG